MRIYSPNFHLFTRLFRGCFFRSPVNMSAKFDVIQNVDIDIGRFKYILIKVYDPANKIAEKYIVRGYAAAGYHGDIYDMVDPEIRGAGLASDCVGGGRIIHDPSAKKIDVFGYSQGYGKADHAKTCEILKQKYPDYKVNWSDEGY